LYVGHRPELIDEKKGWQIDLIAISLGDRKELKHYQNVY
jgi:hypothetical protein